MWPSPTEFLCLFTLPTHLLYDVVPRTLDFAHIETASVKATVKCVGVNFAYMLLDCSVILRERDLPELLLS